MPDSDTLERPEAEARRPLRSSQRVGPRFGAVPQRSEQSENLLLGRPTVSCVIPTYNRGRALADTIEMLLVQDRPPEEIIVVAPTPAQLYTLDELARLHMLASAGCVQWLFQAEPRVYRARNLAARLALGDVLLYLDDDIEIGPGFVRAHTANFADPTVAAVVGRVVDARRPGRVSPLPKGFSGMSDAEKAWRFSEQHGRRVEGLPFTVGGNLSIRRDALLAVGGWDERVLNYGDRDLGIRLHAAGHKVVFDPHAEIVHLALPRGGSRAADPANPVRGWRRVVSIHYLALKYLTGRAYLRFGLWRAARFTILLRRNLLRPSTWRDEATAFLRGWSIARRWVAEGPRLPFASDGGRA